jgi:hypothetical protein
MRTTNAGHPLPLGQRISDFAHFIAVNLVFQGILEDRHRLQDVDPGLEQQGKIFGDKGQVRSRDNRPDNRQVHQQGIAAIPDASAAMAGDHQAQDTDDGDDRKRDHIQPYKLR